MFSCLTPPQELGTWIPASCLDIINLFAKLQGATNNKGDIGHYKYQGPHSTLQEASKVKSERPQKFGAHDFP